MDSNQPPRVYIAGPQGFTEAGLAHHQSVILPAVRAAGLEPLDPWDLPPQMQAVFDLPRGSERQELLVKTNRDVGRRNAELIRDSVGVLAVLDGNDVDSGTAAEIGYAAALNKPVVGYRTDLRVTGDNEATIVNLQVEWFIVESGGQIFANPDPGDRHRSRGAVLEEAVAALFNLLRTPRGSQTGDRVPASYHP
jgi:nucleoside 2-deoxyribosyltransferase